MRQTSISARVGDTDAAVPSLPGVAPSARSAQELRVVALGDIHNGNASPGRDALSCL